MSDYIPASTYKHQNGSAVQFRHFGWNSYRCIFNIKSENIAKHVVAETGCEVCRRHRDFFWLKWFGQSDSVEWGTKQCVHVFDVQTNTEKWDHAGFTREVQHVLDIATRRSNSLPIRFSKFRVPPFAFRCANPVLWANDASPMLSLLSYGRTKAQCGIELL